MHKRIVEGGTREEKNNSKAEEKRRITNYFDIKLIFDLGFPFLPMELPLLHATALINILISSIRVIEVKHG